MQQSFVVPYYRTSPIQIPRRDMVLGAADSVLLTVSIVESDDPCAEALVITGGIGGPSLRMTVWSDAHGRYYGSGGWLPYRDYGWGLWSPSPGRVIWSGVGTPSATQAGTFEVVIPLGAMQTWYLRCRYALQLDWSGNTRSETLAQGILHVRPWSIGGAFTPPPLMTDDYIPVHTETDEQVYA